MSKRTGSSIAAMLTVAAVALVIASCGIEAAEQQAAKTPAEEIAERFSEPAVSPEKLGQPQAQIDAARQKSEAARKSADEAKRIAAAKRAEEKTRKEANAAAAAKAAEQAKADEAEMLAQARAEAEERRAAMEATRSEHEKSELAGGKANAGAEAEQVKLAAERKAQEAAAKAYEAQKQAARQAEEKLIADAKAQVAERERIAEEQRQAEIKAAEAKRSAEVKAVVEGERVAEEQKQAEMKTLEARREAEAKLLAERLRLAEAAREAKAAETARQAAAPAIVAPTSRPVAAPAAVDTVPTVAGPSPAKPRVAILILMDAGNKGIRRFDKTADPILCMKDVCYISEGNEAPARLLSKARALGVGNTWGARAGACQHSLGCVFRDVDLVGTGGVVQPVDMKVMVHDRRESRTVDVDSDCRVDGGRISCRKPISANGYRMWVVPEPLAAKAGGAALDSAVREGLPQSTNAGILPH